MRVRNKEIRARRQRKEQAIKASIKEAKANKSSNPKPAAPAAKPKAAAAPKAAKPAAPKAAKPAADKAEKKPSTRAKKADAAAEAPTATETVAEDTPSTDAE